MLPLYIWIMIVVGSNRGAEWIYELVTGRNPFISATLGDVMRLQMAQTPRRPSDLNPQVTPFFEQVVSSLAFQAVHDRFDLLRPILGADE